MTAPNSPSILVAALRALVKANTWLSETVDQLLPAQYRIDGNRDFLDSMIPRYIKPALTVYDVGGGKHPYVTLEQKQENGLVVVGIDIDGQELDQAPPGVYNRIICADICSYRGQGDADLIICQAVLEHVQDTESAFAAIASILKAGGRALTFVPSRNALFARLNLLLPESMKRKILFFVYPHSRDKAGFKSYYNLCTPKDFHCLAVKHGLQIEEEMHYYQSNYFFCFFPAYLLWRIWLITFRVIADGQAAETFSMSLRKPSSLAAADRDKAGIP